MTLEQAINLLLSHPFSAEDLAGDTLLAERVKIAREYAQAAAWLAIARKTLEAAKETRAEAKAAELFAGPIAELTNEVERLGDRLLHLFLASSASASVH